MLKQLTQKERRIVIKICRQKKKTIKQIMSDLLAYHDEATESTLTWFRYKAPLKRSWEK